MELNGKVAIVTGASSGIGAAIACELGRKGTNVTLTARSRERLAHVASRFRSFEGNAWYSIADLRVEDDLRQLFVASEQRWGRLDILVNAAGVGRNAPLCRGPSEDWREMFEVNVLAMAIATSEALGRFDSQLGGRILNISSMAAHRWPRTGGFYAATKHAVRAMTEGLRSELASAGSPSRVMSVSPEFVDTPFFLEYFRHDEVAKQDALRGQPLLSAADVAKLAIYLLEAPDDVWFRDVTLGPKHLATLSS